MLLFLLIPHAAGREGEINENGLPFLLAVILGIGIALQLLLFGLLLGLPAMTIKGRLSGYSNNCCCRDF